MKRAITVILIIVVCFGVCLGTIKIIDMQNENADDRSSSEVSDSFEETSSSVSTLTEEKVKIFEGDSVTENFTSMCQGLLGDETEITVSESDESKYSYITASNNYADTKNFLILVSGFIGLVSAQQLI